jgi:hypothetical protein
MSSDATGSGGGGRLINPGTARLHGQLHARTTDDGVTAAMGTTTASRWPC